jgi:hypothetical protein
MTIRHFTIAGVALVSIAMGALAFQSLLTKVDDKETYRTFGAAYNLSEDQIQALERDARSGDADAAWRLYLYYQWSGTRHAVPGWESRWWFEVAASNGHLGARSSLVKEYSAQYFKQPAEAKKRLEAAAANGWPEAQRELDWIKRYELGKK